MEDPIAWSVISGYHSQLTGVLAGFVFAALTLLLSNPPRGKSAKDISDSLLLLLLVFLALILASFLYAVATGERTRTGPIFCNLFASFAFSLAGVGMFLSMALLFCEYGTTEAVIHGAHRVFHGILLVAAVNMVMTVGNAMVTLEGREFQKEWATLGWALPAVLPPLVSHVLRRRRKRGPHCHPSLRPLTVFGFRYVIGVTLLCGVIVSMPDANRMALYPFWAKHALMALLGWFYFECERVLPDPLPEPDSSQASSGSE